MTTTYQVWGEVEYVAVSGYCFADFKRKESSELAQETTDQSRATIQKVAEEGMVLLK